MPGIIAAAHKSASALRVDLPTAAAAALPGQRSYVGAAQLPQLAELAQVRSGQVYYSAEVQDQRKKRSGANRTKVPK